MGYLTTFTVSNDGADEILKHPKDFAEKIFSACCEYNKKDIGLGNHGNMIVPQKPRHADDHTIYIHMGNTVVEMNAYSTITKELMVKHPNFFDDLLRFMEHQTKDLKKLQKIQKHLIIEK